MVYYSQQNAPKQTPIWAFMYEHSSDKGKNSLFSKPVKGEIIKKRFTSEFVPYYKDTNAFRKSGNVNYLSRYYADTYEEAVEAFNQMIEDNISNLYEQINIIEKHKIETKNEQLNSIIIAIKKAINDYGIDHVDIYEDKNHMLSIMYHSTHNSFIIEDNIGCVLDKDRKQLKNKLNKLCVGYFCE